MNIDRHVISPRKSLLMAKSKQRKRKTSRRASIGADDTMNSKDYFEPDEISMASAPHGIGREILIDLHDDGENNRMA